MTSENKPTYLPLNDVCEMTGLSNYELKLLQEAGIAVLAERDGRAIGVTELSIPNIIRAKEMKEDLDLTWPKVIKRIKSGS